MVCAAIKCQDVQAAFLSFNASQTGWILYHHSLLDGNIKLAARLLNHHALLPRENALQARLDEEKLQQQQQQASDDSAGDKSAAAQASDSLSSDSEAGADDDDSEADHAQNRGRRGGRSSKKGRSGSRLHGVYHHGHGQPKFGASTKAARTAAPAQANTPIAGSSSVLEPVKPTLLKLPLPLQRSAVVQNTFSRQTYLNVVEDWGMSYAAKGGHVAAVEWLFSVHRFDSLAAGQAVAWLGVLC